MVGGIGASLLLPAMQSLIHGNFEGAAQTKAYALVGAAAAIAAAVGPLLGGFITTYLSWRVGFLLEVVIIAIVLSGIGSSATPLHRASGRRRGRRRPLGPGHGQSCSASWCGRKGGESVAASWRSGWSVRGAGRLAQAAEASGQADPARPRPVQPKHFRLDQQLLQQIALGGTMIALPIYLQMVLEYNAMLAGLSIALLSLSMFGVACSPGSGREGDA